MLRVNEITLFIFLCVNMAWQIQHIISVLIFYFLRVPWPLGLPLELSLSHDKGFSRSSWLGFALLLPNGVPSSGFMGGCFVFATLEPILLFTIGILGGNLHHST